MSEDLFRNALAIQNVVVVSLKEGLRIGQQDLDEALDALQGIYDVTLAEARGALHHQAVHALNCDRMLAVLRKHGRIK